MATRVLARFAVGAIIFSAYTAIIIALVSTLNTIPIDVIAHKDGALSGGSSVINVALDWLSFMKPPGLVLYISALVAMVIAESLAAFAKTLLRTRFLS